MNEIATNVIANVIAWPIIIGLGLLAGKTWRILKKADAYEKELIESKVAYRTAASAQAVSDIVIGCTAILAGLVWIIFLLNFRMLEVQSGYFQMNYEVHQLFAKSLLSSSQGKPIELPQFPNLKETISTTQLYLGYCFIGFGFLNVFFGKRLLSHLNRAAFNK